MIQKLFFIGILCAFISCNTSDTNSKITVLNYNDFKKSIAHKNIQLIDVRTKKEYDLGAIDNAILMDVLQTAKFEQQITSLDKNKKVYLYCKSGSRSAKARKILIKKGFTEVYELSGGYKSWVKNK